MKRLPNILTLFRLILTIIFIFCLTRQGLAPAVTAVFVFLLASLTDYYDGYLAKKYDAVTNFGKIMDPIADKFLILAAFYIFTGMGIISAWMFGIILVREVLVTGTRMMFIGKGLYLAAERAGKYKTVSQIVAVYVILVFILLQRHPVLSAGLERNLDLWLTAIGMLMAVTVLMTVISGMSYLWNNRWAFAAQNRNGES